MKYGSLLLLCMALGCAAKKPIVKPVEVPVAEGSEIKFDGVKAGRCHAASVSQDAKTKVYTVHCAR